MANSVSFFSKCGGLWDIFSKEIFEVKIMSEV
jgi:hypothetical protein